MLIMTWGAVLVAGISLAAGAPRVIWTPTSFCKLRLCTISLVRRRKPGHTWNYAWPRKTVVELQKLIRLSRLLFTMTLHRAQIMVPRATRTQGMREPESRRRQAK